MLRSSIRVLIPALAVACCATAGVLEDWGDLYGQAEHAAAVNDYVTAEDLYSKALREALLFGDNDPKVASTSQALGVTLHFEKKLGASEEAIQRAVSIYSVNPGPKSLEFGQAQFDLAAVLSDEGKYEPALQATKVLLPIFDASLEPNDNRTAAALCMQGDLFRMLKLYASAEAPLTRCAEIDSEDGDMGSPQFGEAANSLAIVYQHLGKYQLADRYFTYAEKIREDALTLLSPQVADTLEAHAALLRQMGRAKEAADKEKLAASIRAHTGKK